MYDILTKKYTPTWGSILRIALWTVFFIWMAGFAIPKNLEENVAFKNSIKGSRITSMMPLYTDRRLMREDIVFSPDTLNIAWVCDSSCLLSPVGNTTLSPDVSYYKFIPEEVSKALSKRFPGRKIHVYLYDELGPFPPDEQALVEKIISSRPDIIVFSDNVLRSYDPFSLFARDQSRPALTKIWLRQPGMRLLPFFLISPATNFYALVGEHLRSIREMTYFKAAFSDTVSDNMRIFSAVPAEDGTGAGKQAMIPDDPAPALRRFWIKYLDTIDPAVKADERRLKNPIPSLPDPQTYIYAVSEETIAALANSGIPTLVYPMPLAPFYREDANVGYKIEAYEQEMRLLQRRYKDNHALLIIDRIPDLIIKEITFKPQDVAHMENAESLIPYMTKEVEKMVIIYNSRKEVKDEALRH